MSWLPAALDESPPLVGWSPAWVGAALISAEEKNAVQAALTTMTSDVAKAAKAERIVHAEKTWGKGGAAHKKLCMSADLKWDAAGNKCLQEPDPDHLSYAALIPDADKPLTKFQLERWLPFVMDWGIYAMGPGWMVNTDDYEALVIKYGQLRSEWTKELGQATSAPEIAPSTASVADELGKGAKKAAGKVGEAATYGLAGLGTAAMIALVVLGVVYLAPVVAPLMRRGK